MYLVPLALRHSWISAIGVKDMATGLATEVVGQSLVDRCSDRRTSRTARSTAKQATKDGASNDTQRMAPALGFSAGKGRRGTLDRPRHATEGSGRGLSATARYDERGVTTRAGDGHVRTIACCAETALLLALLLADRKPIRNTMANATRHSSTG